MTLNEFFKENPKVAIAFSGGVDSSYLLYEAKKCNAEVIAYYVNSQFQPGFELEDAKRIAQYTDCEMKILEVDVLCDPIVASNPKDRCYHCKRRIFFTILEAAAKDGFTTILDGTNYSDDIADRPGYRALGEMKVLSPLRLCELTKAEIRKRSREAGLFTWNKSAYACLATRIPTGDQITAEKLKMTENAEELLFSMGFDDFRVRYLDGYARIQVRASQLAKLMDYRDKIKQELGKDYKGVLLDLETRDEQ